MRAMPSREPARLLLKRDRERSLLRRHPWVFSGAIDALHGQAASGDTVEVCAHDGSFLAWAAYSPSSRIIARVWDFARDTAIDDAFFARRIAAAVALRRTLLPPELSAYRVVNAESDGLPGLTVDRYAGQLVLQATSAGAAANRERIARALAAATGLAAIYERSEGEVLELEGLPSQRGPLLGPEPAAPIVIEEHGLRIAVDVRAGHKTGFYLDQRDNRALVRELAGGRDVLDCFCYTGAFGLSAAAGGARSVTAVDSSDEALAAARANAVLNAPSGAAVAFERADVFEFLRRARDARRDYDLIVLDPPKFAPTARHAERATRAYKDINLLAFKLLRPGGLLLTFSCSAAIGAELFQKVVAGAAADARVDAQFTRRLGAGADHPVALSFPEGDYLKGLLCSSAPAAAAP
jgi:23S rRNA (cytosine1962-C5)-methyltransferase